MALLLLMSRSLWLVALHCDEEIISDVKAAGFYTVESVVYAPKKKLMEIKVRTKLQTCKIPLLT